MLVTICGPNLRDQSKGDLHVHAADCGDLRRGAIREPAYHDGWTIEAGSYAEVVQEVYPPEDFNYDPEEAHLYADTLWFAPCTAGLPA